MILITKNFSVNKKSFLLTIKSMEKVVNSIASQYDTVLPPPITQEIVSFLNCECDYCESGVISANMLHLGPCVRAYLEHYWDTCILCVQNAVDEANEYYPTLSRSPTVRYEITNFICEHCGIYYCHLAPAYTNYLDGEIPEWIEDRGGSCDECYWSRKIRYFDYCDFKKLICYHVSGGKLKQGRDRQILQIIFAFYEC